MLGEWVIIGLAVFWVVSELAVTRWTSGPERLVDRRRGYRAGDRTAEQLRPPPVEWIQPTRGR
jgi:hypothetical protein